jgi:hypothetical protein
MPETNEPEFGRLSRALKGVWNSRLQYTGDFESLSEAFVAIEAAYPEVEHIRCYEWPVEYPNEIVCRPIWPLGIHRPGTVVRGPASLKTSGHQWRHIRLPLRDSYRVPSSETYRSRDTSGAACVSSGAAGACLA